MSPENARKLIEIYPEMFRYGESCEPFPLFGFECGDGWFDLLKDLITEIKDICIKSESDDIKATQIKEKYGTLRFYTNWETDDIEKAIWKAEERSSETCESCGQEGELKTLRGYWCVTNCDDCFKEAEE